jgi:carbon storage regulator CsrA
LSNFNNRDQGVAGARRRIPARLPPRKGNMLVLSRKTGQSLIFTLPDGQECRVTVTRISAGEARIGIDAPPGVRVVREEIKHMKPKSGAV